jgi:hypothetical protein
LEPDAGLLEGSFADSPAQPGCQLESSRSHSVSQCAEERRANTWKFGMGTTPIRTVRCQFGKADLLPLSGGSRGSNQSPPIVSAKREFVGNRPETFRHFAPEIARPGVRRPERNAEKAGNSGPVRHRLQISVRRRTAWLGREGSNLRMAESKSAALPLGYAPKGGEHRRSTGGVPRLQRRSIEGLRPIQQAVSANLVPKPGPAANTHIHPTS